MLNPARGVLKQAVATTVGIMDMAASGWGVLTACFYYCQFFSLMKFSLLIINFKAYLEASGRLAVGLAKMAERAARELGVEIVVAPSHVDLALVAQSVSIPVFAQGATVEKAGAFTA
ncbi:MAG: triose-phosphate isomerase, partial [Pyrobaculum sp.]